ncbi:MAG: alpha/beta hydrolase [Crocosphaera sp.]
MQSNDLSLIHQVRNPIKRTSQKPPVLFMLHSIFSDEEKLMSFAPMIDDRFCVISIRGPLMLRNRAYGWFPMKLKKSENNFLLKDVEDCRFLLIDFIDKAIETYGLDPQQIYLMGFSQGAVMSFSLALTIPHRIAALVAMNGRIGATILNQMYEQELVDSKGLEGLPVFAAHGIDDLVIPILYGRETCDHLQNLKVDLDYREYAIGHELSSTVIEDGSAWLSSQLDRSSKSVVSIH